MRLSQFHLATVKEVPADAEIASHQLMLRSGMIRKLAAGIYTWTPLGLRVLRKVEAVVREEMNGIGAIEMLMPSVQPRELWEETGRWEKFGGQLLKIRDRKEQEFCYGPTHEEVVTDFARQELQSYKQLPLCVFQIQTKFRDEIRPRFGVMRSREFLMKDAYSFHLSAESLAETYTAMYGAYSRIFSRLGLRFRAVQADTGAIGGNASHEFQVLAESGEDALVFSDASEYAANIEKAEVLAPTVTRPAASMGMEAVDTPHQKTCEEVAELLGIPLSQTVRTLVFADAEGMVIYLVRGDHQFNDIKAARLAEVAGRELLLATDAQLKAYLGEQAEAGFLGPLHTAQPVLVIADAAVAVMSDFVIGANRRGFHYRGVNWGRDLAEPEVVADIRNAVAGDPSPDGHGQLQLARGIEVGHIFQLGSTYAEAMKATVLNDQGKPQTLTMGCYGIGVSRIVAAAIEQRHDANGIVWPEAMAPWRVVICVINPKSNPDVTAAAEALYQTLQSKGLDPLLDDRGLRPGAMFADMELIGIPHRVVVSERGIQSATFEYRFRAEAESESLSEEQLLQRFS
ncbi:proline--tRNA ligase [Frateuria aurantia]